LLPEEAGSEAPAVETGFVFAGAFSFVVPAFSFGVSLAQASSKKQRKQTIRTFTVN
jgi:hypothetical protein